jgi:hypothetical protein
MFILRWNIAIMHQPVAVADEEGVRFVNGKVVHPLVGIRDEGDALDCAVIAAETPDQITEFEFASIDPFAFDIRLKITSIFNGVNSI